MPEYKYYIEGIEVHVLNERELKFKWSRKEDTIFHRLKSDNKYLIANSMADGYTDYDYLKTIADGDHTRIGKYDVLEFKIVENIYVGDESRWTLRDTMEFKITDCKFNVHRRQVEFTATIKDDYIDFYANGDEEINLMDITNRYSIDINHFSTIEFYPESFVASNPDDTIWSLWIDFYYDNATGLIYVASQNGDAHISIWACEQIILHRYISPTGSDWVNIEESNELITWRRPFDTANFSSPALADIVYRQNDYYSHPYTIPSGYKLAVETRFWQEVHVVTTYDFRYELQAIAHSQCIDLKEAIEYLIEQVAPDFIGDVKSSFLFNDAWSSDYNEPALGTENYVSLVDPNVLNKLYLIEKSDFKKPNASQSATSGNVTFKKFMDDLRELIANNLKWYIDIDGNFRLEHISYFIDNIGFDLLESKYSEYVQTVSNFEYLSKYIYSREIWQMNETGNLDFVDNEIIYGNVIAINGEDENKKEHKVNELYTDIDYMNEHIKDISNNGFVMICAEGAVGSLSCKATNGVISDESYQNADISFANIIQLYGKHNRPAEPFTMNGVEDVNALSLRKLKRQAEIEFVNEDDRIDFSKNIHTTMGAGEVEEAEEWLTKKIKVSLLHEH